MNWGNTDSIRRNGSGSSPGISPERLCARNRSPNDFAPYLFPKEYIDFKSWKILGPYIPAVYNHYKYYTALELPRQRDYVEVMKNDEQDILNNLLDNYIDCSLYRLVQLSKQKKFSDLREEESESSFFS